MNQGTHYGEKSVRVMYKKVMASEVLTNNRLKLFGVSLKRLADMHRVQAAGRLITLSMAPIFQQSATTAALKKMLLATLVSTQHLYRPLVNSDVLSVINN